MDVVYKKIQKLGEMLVALGAISFVYYFIGFLYSSAYFAALGVSVKFLDFSYQSYVVDGIINTIFLVCFVPIFLDWYLIYSSICEKENIISSTNKEIKEVENELDRNKKNHTDYEIQKQKINDLKIVVERSTTQLNQCKERFLSNNPFRIKFVGNIVLLILCVIAIILSYFFNRPSLVASFVQGLTGLIFCFLLFNYIKSIIDGSKRMRMSFIWFFSCIFIIVFPFFSGYINGYAACRDNPFKKINIVTQEGQIFNVNLLGFGRNYIILKNENKVIYIPESEIKKIESNE